MTNRNREMLFQALEQNTKESHDLEVQLGELYFGPVSPFNERGEFTGGPNTPYPSGYDPKFMLLSPTDYGRAVDIRQKIMGLEIERGELLRETSRFLEDNQIPSLTMDYSPINDDARTTVSRGEGDLPQWR